MSPSSTRALSAILSDRTIAAPDTRPPETVTASEIASYFSARKAAA